MFSFCLGVNFPSSTVTLSTTEELPINTIIGSPITVTSGNNVAYTILGGDPLGLFKLVGTDTTLEIQNAQVIDYETLGDHIAPAGLYASFGLTIEANDNDGTDSLYAEVHVVNDAYAAVEPARLSYTLGEKYQTGSVFHIINTKVPYGLVQYAIATENMTASHAAKFALISPFGGSIQLASGQTWDFENDTVIFLYVKIRPFISGLYNSQSYQRIEITIRDVNDNSNNFTQSSYTFSIDESATVGTSVGSVTADDADASSTNNQTVYYVLNNMFSNEFIINNSTGSITVAGTLNYESVSSYYLTVCATDEATDNYQTVPTNEARIGCVPVTISVNNTDDNLPQISPASTIIVISEKIAGNASIHAFSATDADNVTPVVKYNTTLTSSTAMSIFTVSTAGVVTVNATNLIDYEGTQTYDLYVYAEDGNSAATVSGVAHLKVVVLDTNDNSPTFVSNVYEFSVAEGSGTGTVAGAVNAYDNDSSNANNAIQYSFLVDPTVFAINLTTGEITVAGNIFVSISYVSLFSLHKVHFI